MKWRKREKRAKCGNKRLGAERGQGPKGKRQGPRCGRVDSVLCQPGVGRAGQRGPKWAKTPQKKSHLQERAGSKCSLCPPKRADPILAGSPRFIPKTSPVWVQGCPCPIPSWIWLWGTKHDLSSLGVVWHSDVLLINDEYLHCKRGLTGGNSKTPKKKKKI